MSAIGSGWRFEWRRSWSDVWEPSFLDRWSQLYRTSACRQVYHQPALVRAWADTCGREMGAEPLIGIASHPSGCSALLPLVVGSMDGRILRRRQVDYVGGDLFGYHDPMCSVDSATVDWTVFWEAARQSVGASCDQALIRSVHGDVAPVGSELCHDKSPVLQLNEYNGFVSLMAACSVSLRGDLRRQRRRLSERGPLSLWIASPGDAGRALRDWRSNGAPAYRAVWDRRTERNSAWRPGYEEFLERVISSGVAEGWGHYSVLSVASEPIAWHVGFADRGRLYWSVPTHLVEWESNSPGKVLLGMLVEALYATGGWSELHFQTGGHAYKMAWRPAFADLRVVRWHAPGLRGTALSVYDTLRRRACGSDQSVFEQNIAHYSHAWSVGHYTAEEGLREIERDLIERFMPTPPSRVLDLGCGAGRTTAGLAQLGYTVVGIDLSETLLTHARERYPGLDFRMMNAAALTLPDRSCDAALFSFNGLDSLFPVSLRCQCLSEVSRVLRPGGIFVFSTHNGFPHLLEGDFRHLRAYRNVLRILRAQVKNRYLLDWYVRYPEPAGAELLFMATPSVTRKQLRDAGFESLDVRGASGSTNMTRVRWREVHVYFVARKRL